MNPHKQYALLVSIGSVVALGLMLSGGIIGVFWFFPTLPIILIRWASYAFKRVNAKSTMKKAVDAALEANKGNNH